MENDAVVEPTLSQSHEVRYSFRGMLVVQLNSELPNIGFNAHLGCLVSSHDSWMHDTSSSAVHTVGSWSI